MVEVIKDGVIMVARDKNQLAAFRNNGWKECDAETPAKNEDEHKRPTKTEVSRMSVDELKTYAPTIGIEVTEESTGTKLKEQIIAKLGL